MPPESEAIRFEALPFAELTTLRLHELLRLRAEVFVMEQRCFYLDPDNHDLEAIHVLGLLGGRIVACARCFPHGDAIKVGRVLTSSAVRGRGVGKQLMRAVLGVIGKRASVLEAQAHLQRFYESFGYRATGPVYNLDGIPHLPMRRPAAM